MNALAMDVTNIIIGSLILIAGFWMFKMGIDNYLDDSSSNYLTISWCVKGLFMVLLGILVMFSHDFFPV